MSSGVSFGRRTFRRRRAERWRASIPGPATSCHYPPRMADQEDARPASSRHQRTRAHRQQAGVVAVQLLLPPELARRLDEVRGPRPRTAVALEWLFAQSGLEAASVPPPLRRGRPPKVAPVSPPPSSPPTPTATAPLIPLALEVADWSALLARVADPRRTALMTPPERGCRREQGVDGLVRLRWDRVYNDEEFHTRHRFARKQGGTWQREPAHFEGAGGWVLTPAAADACIRHFNLVDLSPYERLPVSYEGWTIERVSCAPDPAPDRYGVMVMDFEAALAAVAADAARCLGLALWLEARGHGRAWYRLREAAGENLPLGALISEPLLAGELDGSPFSVWRERGPRVISAVAPGALRAAWAAVSLRAVETADGLVRSEPHTACPGHRLGGLLPAWLRAAAKGKEALLMRAEWDRLAERAKRLGVATELVPRPLPAVALAFVPARLPGWDGAAPATRCGHRLFAFQQDAVRFALEQDLRCLIGDEMGLGKTASAIASVNAANLQRVVVVCPLNALGVWQREVVAWSAAAGPAPAVTVVRATAETPELPAAGWVLVTYGTLAGRDQRVRIAAGEDYNALCAFLLTRLGDPGEGLVKCGWDVRELEATKPPTLDGERPRTGRAATPKKKARWEFTLLATPRVVAVVGELAAVGTGTWRPDTALRGRLERVVVRLGRPVLAALQAWGADLLVADEAHRLKDPAARRTRVVRELGAPGRRVMLLTGTPLRNHAVEGKALLEIILPERVWAATGRRGEAVKAVVKDLLAWRMVRRLKRDVLKELPPKLRQRVPVVVDGVALEGYADAMTLAERNFRDALRETGSLSDARTAALPMWTTARRLLGLAKLETGVPVDLITQVVEAKGAVIVFAHHHEVLDALEKALREKKAHRRPGGRAGRPRGAGAGGGRVPGRPPPGVLRRHHLSGRVHHLDPGRHGGLRGVGLGARRVAPG